MIKLPSKNISKLDLSNKNLKVIPDEVFKLRNLIKLNLSNNQIKSIPKGISKLKRLENLDLSNNKIDILYAKLFELCKLKVLNLNNNRIKNLPKQINDLKEIEKLLICNNEIENLNEKFFFPNIQTLNISDNNFKKFPEVIINLRSLKRLWINKLDLEDFPLHNIDSKLINLKSIYCYGPMDSNLNIDHNYKILTGIKGNSIYILKKIIRDNLKEKLPIIIYDKTNNNQENNTDDLGKKLNDTMEMKKLRIFISYSHKDNLWLEDVKEYIKALKFEYDFDQWDDTRINTGKNWKVEIEKALNSSKIAILIISTSFLASDFIQNNELPPLLKNAKEKGTIIMPLIVGHCRFTKDKNLNVFQAANDPSKPLNSLKKHEQEEILLKLSNEIADIIERKI